MELTYGIQEFKKHSDRLINSAEQDILFGKNMSELETVPLFNSFALEYINLLKEGNKVEQDASDFQKEGSHKLVINGHHVEVSAKRTNLARNYPLIEKLVLTEPGMGCEIHNRILELDDIAASLSFDELKRFAYDFQFNFTVQTASSKYQSKRHLKERIPDLYRIGNFPNAGL